MHMHIRIQSSVLFFCYRNPTAGFSLEPSPSVASFILLAHSLSFLMNAALMNVLLPYALAAYNVLVGS